MTVPVLEAVDAFLFGIVLVIFAYGIAIGFVFTLPEDYGETLPDWMKIEGVGQLKEHPVRGGHRRPHRHLRPHRGRHRRFRQVFEWSMLVLPASILMIALALRMIELAGGKGQGAQCDDGEGGH